MPLTVSLFWAESNRRVEIRVCFPGLVFLFLFLCSFHNYRASLNPGLNWVLPYFVPKVRVAPFFSSKTKNSIILAYKMFHDTKSIKTFHQSSYKILNCSKHRNWENAASVTELSPSVQLQDGSSTNPGGSQVWAKQNGDEALGAWDKHLRHGCGKGPRFHRWIPTHTHKHTNRHSTQKHTQTYTYLSHGLQKRSPDSAAESPTRTPSTHKHTHTCKHTPHTTQTHTYSHTQMHTTLPPILDEINVLFEGEHECQETIQYVGWIF